MRASASIAAPVWQATPRPSLPSKAASRTPRWPPCYDTAPPHRCCVLLPRTFWRRAATMPSRPNVPVPRAKGIERFGAKENEKKETTTSSRHKRKQALVGFDLDLVQRDDDDQRFKGVVFFVVVERKRRVKGREERRRYKRESVVVVVFVVKSAFENNNHVEKSSRRSSLTPFTSV